MFKISIWFVTILLLASCDKDLKDENERLKKALMVAEADSESLANSLDQVNSLLDSIEVTQQTINIDLESGMTYTDYASRIKAINQYIKDSEAQLTAVESKLSNAKSKNKVYLGIIKNLRKELASKTGLIQKLEQQVSNYKKENEVLIKTVDLQTNELSQQAQAIARKREELKALDDTIKIMKQNLIDTQAAFYYKQGLAAEKLAAKIRLAPKKKKAQYQVAYDLYEQAFKLGKIEAYPKMQSLEDKID